MKFSSSEISLARSFVDKITTVFAEMAATEHHAERASIADVIGALIRPGNDNRVVNFAQEIIDGKIKAAVDEFLDLTLTFYVDESRARRAAETSDLVVSLNHQRNSLNESPSIDQARQIQEIFIEFLAAHTAQEPVDNLGANSEDKAPSDLHENGATAGQQAHTES